MSLITQSEEFLARSLEDTDAFGWLVPKIVNPSTGQEQTDLSGQVRQISMLIDFDTGTEVQEQQYSLTLRLSSITIGEPQKNWLVDITDTAGQTYNCYVVEAMPDRTLGLIVLKLGIKVTV